MIRTRQNCTRGAWRLLIVALLATAGAGATARAQSGAPERAPELAETFFAGGPAGAVQVLQLVEGDPLRRHYPGALTSLIAEINRETTLVLDPDPVVIRDFADPRLLRAPFLYVNAGDRSSWALSAAEQDNLRQFLQRGGFLYIDAGISAEFLREVPQAVQAHSFAEWEVVPAVAEAMATVLPDAAFAPLPRAHPIFRSFHQGLPGPETLPEAMRDYVVNEKWPQGTYSLLGIVIDGRLAVLASPIIAMGWGRNEIGQWTNSIGFRVRESAEGMTERLRAAAYSGRTYRVRREDGQYDRIFCQPETMPAWVEEPDGRFRIFRYYYGPEISDYAHLFYTRLGVNILVHAFSDGIPVQD
jgi:hypothetical protein